MKEVNQTPACGMHEVLVSYLYDEATPDEARQFEAHINECAGCKEEVAAFGQVRDQLQHWQVADLPIVRVVADPQPQKRPFLAVLKELFQIMPVWVKVAGVAAMLLFVMALTGTRISVGRDGVSLSASLIQLSSTDKPAPPVNSPNVKYASAEQLEQLRSNLAALVSQKITESEQQQKDSLKAELVSLQSDLKTMRTADLARIVARVQEHQSRLQTIERDLDRHEGSDLTDILFSEMIRKPHRPSDSGDDGSD